MWHPHWTITTTRFILLLLLCIDFADVVVQALALTRPEAATLIQERILPTNEYSKRTGLGRDAQGVRADDLLAVTGQDERLHQTYGEFPLDSLDQLLDLALTGRIAATAAGPVNDLTVVDLGSGCGRLCLYMALTRPQQWQVHGIELSPLLHEEALAALARAHECVTDDGDNNNKTQQIAVAHFHCGPASDFGKLLAQADLIFCYSTAFASSGFSPETGTMVLAREWNDLLTEHCRPESVVITTDKSLDARWNIVDRLDVRNPEVFESTGFVHRLKSRGAGQPTEPWQQRGDATLGL